MTIENKFCQIDEYGLLPEDKRIPYISLVLTEEQANIIKTNPKFTLYICDGNSVFDIRNQGKIMDKKMMFILVGDLK